MRLPLAQSSGESIGSLELEFDRSPLLTALFSRLLVELFFFTICAGLLYFVLSVISRNIENELQAVVRVMKGGDGHDLKNVRVLEFRQLASELTTLVALKTQYSREVALAEVSRQVAHDIRSPLTALDIVLKDESRDLSQHRDILTGVAHRIRDISRQLLKVPTPKSLEESLPSRTSVQQSVGSLLQQKRIEFGHRISWQMEPSPEARDFFVRAEVDELERVLSNVLNNAAEAISAHGEVKVQWTRNEEQVAISISDNGRGIPSHLLANVVQRGFTFGKRNGSGLGLSSAKETVEKWGGQIEITSQEGRGTRVILSLPAA